MSYPSSGPNSGIPTLTVLSVPVSLVVSDTTPTLTLSGQTALIFSWAQGTPLPTPSLFVLSSNEPLDFTVTVAVTAPTNPATGSVSLHASGVAYSWGTAVSLSFDPLLAYTTNVGDTLSGTVTITPAVGNPLTAVHVTITVAAPVVKISSVFPASIPVQPTDLNAYSFLVSGSGFNAGTVVKVNGSNPKAKAVLNGNTLAVQVADTAILDAPGTVTITAKNLNDAIDTANTATVTVTTSPMIYAATNSASYQQESAPGATPRRRPVRSAQHLWRQFLGPGGGAVVNGTPDATFFNFPTTVSSGGNAIVVKFYKADTTTTIVTAPMLFASQQQINMVVTRRGRRQCQSRTSR